MELEVDLQHACVLGWCIAFGVWVRVITDRHELHDDMNHENDTILLGFDLQGADAHTYLDGNVVCWLCDAVG